MLFLHEYICMRGPAASVPELQLNPHLSPQGIQGEEQGQKVQK